MADGRGILIVDDEPAVRDVLAVLLEEEGYVVRAAGSGREALAILGAWRPDLILLDLMMPVMDGPTFRLEQQATGAAADVPLVVLSAARDAVEYAQRLGAVDVIAKPFDVDGVLAIVARILQEAPT